MQDEVFQDVFRSCHADWTDTKSALMGPDMHHAEVWQRPLLFSWEQGSGPFACQSLPVAVVALSCSHTPRAILLASWMVLHHALTAAAASKALRSTFQQKPS